VQTPPQAPDPQAPEPRERNPQAPDRPPATPRAHRAAVAGLVSAAVLATLITWAVISEGQAVLSFDQRLTELVRGWADPLGWPVEVAHAIGMATAPLPSTVVTVIAVVTLVAIHRPAAALLVAMCGLLGVTVAETLKSLVGRLRPPGAEQYEPDVLRSYPSGHAMAGIYVYLFIGIVLVLLGRALGRSWLVAAGWALVGFGPLIGVSRLVLGVHWPSDVVGGWALAATVVLALSLLFWHPVARGWASAEDN